jgi:uncharacterized membrane protein
MIAEGFALYFILGMLFFVFATVSAKGYGIILSALATIIAGVTSPIIILLLCLFIVPAREGSFWDAD